MTNFVCTITWVISKLLLGKTYLAATATGIVAILLVHNYVMPWMFGSLWVLRD
jgi:hypothetical protein